MTTDVAMVKRNKVIIIDADNCDPVWLGCARALSWPKRAVVDIPLTNVETPTNDLHLLHTI